jgi:cytochrome c553
MDSLGDSMLRIALWVGIVQGLISFAHADDDSARRNAARVDLQQATALTGDAAQGRQLYGTCAACHGVNGMGQPDGTTPVIAGQHYAVLLKQLVDYRHAQRWDLRMEHVVELKKFAQLQDLVDVAAYVATLPSDSPVGLGSGKHLGEGAWTFVLRCAACHGASAAGSDSARIPRLAGQHYEYLRRQFFDIAEGRRPMLSASHARFLHELDQADVDGMADYLSRIVLP